MGKVGLDNLPCDGCCIDGFVDLYSVLMEEIKQRYFLVRGLINSEWSMPSRVADIEFVYLQIRKILELIALGSLVINASSYRKSKKELQKQWNAEKIVRRLEKINPDFYPVPIRMEAATNLEKYQNIVALESGFLTKDDFIALYNICASVVHAENPFKNAKYYGELRDSIGSWLEKIKNLLDFHHIRPVSSLYFCIVQMGNEDADVTAQLFGQILEE